ncbi:MAG: hypothetical protein M3Z25_15945 [Actinomycetota bacterium]|nr:hypothetical protein [Actinomycetota bacterium]PZS18439.1 MAG: hypothetical protein DLM60_11855 [Pseudonocardiales bacterium]
MLDMIRRRDRLLISVGLVLVVGAGVVLVGVFRLPAADRNDVAGFWGFALGVAGAVVSLWGWLRRVWRPIDLRPVNTLADLLAEGVHGQWRKAATERVLLTPPPIPIRWSLCSLPVAGDLTAALDGPFTPLPGLTAVTERQLRDGGGRRELFEVYAGLASGRVVVVGAPGSGKSGSAVLLLLDALEHRERVNDIERARVPVPVLFTVHGWDPTTCSVQDWLAAHLAATYPLFQRRGGQAEAAALVAAGAIALIFDGFDEMDQAARPAALQALSDAPFRVVVLTRSQEMVDAAGAAWLAGAAALRLHDVTGPEGAEYLQRARTGPSPSGWSQLLTHLREHPDSVLTRGMSTPLALTLVRDTYRVGDDVSELLTTSRCGSADDLERHLIARVLPDAYTPRPGRPKPRYSLPQATQTLSFIARQMNHDDTRDLAWWHIPRWAPTLPRILISMFAGGLAGGFLTALAFGIWVLLYNFSKGLSWDSSAPGAVFSDMQLGLIFGFGIGLPFGFRYGRGDRAPKRVKNWRAINMRLVLATGLVYGLVGGFAVELTLTGVLDLINEFVPSSISTSTLVFGLAFGLVLGLVFGPIGGIIEGERRSQGSRKHWRNGGILGLGVGLIWVTAELIRGAGLLPVLIAGLLFGLGGGLMGGLTGGLVSGLAGGLTAGEERPWDPRESWRNDRVVGLVFGLVVGLAVGLGEGISHGLFDWALDGVSTGRWSGVWSSIGSGFSVEPQTGVALGLVCGITSSVTWPTALAWFQLRFSRVPAIGLMPFLEDARARGVLRTVGAVYQFRHASLQDHLT